MIATEIRETMRLYSTAVEPFSSRRNCANFDMESLLYWANLSCLGEIVDTVPIAATF